MKLIICGGRSYKLTETDRVYLDIWLDRYNITEIVSGGCSGADRCGEQWAKQRGLKITRFPANWADGKRAGPVRNQAMAEYADYCAVFPGGKGTADMEHRAKAEGLVILKKGKTYR